MVKMDLECMELNGVWIVGTTNCLIIRNKSKTKRKQRIVVICLILKETNGEMSLSIREKGFSNRMVSNVFVMNLLSIFFNLLYF